MAAGGGGWRRVAAGGGGRRWEAVTRYLPDVRTVALTLACLLVSSVSPGVSRSCRAEESGAPGPDPAQQYRAQSKSGALAMTLEALCPLAGAGVLYGGDTEKAVVLGGLSAVAIGAGAGAIFALVHLGGQHPGGTERVLLDVEQGSAAALLAGAVVSYAILRISGLVLARRTVASFNAALQEQLGIPPPSRWCRSTPSPRA